VNINVSKYKINVSLLHISSKNGSLIIYYILKMLEYSKNIRTSHGDLCCKGNYYQYEVTKINLKIKFFYCKYVNKIT